MKNTVLIYLQHKLEIMHNGKGVCKYTHSVGFIVSNSYFATSFAVINMNSYV